VTVSAPGIAAEPPTQRRFTLRERLLLWLITVLGTAAIRVIGFSLRYEYSVEEEAGVHSGGPPENLWNAPGIFGFWHSCIFGAAYYCRSLRIGVLTSRSFDGEYIARIIENFGYCAVRGSSSRGVVGGLRGMIRHVQEGHLAAFTCDGPRGPAEIAKPGPVLLARQTGVPLRAFHVAARNCWQLKTWDRTAIPKPFSRVFAYFSSPIHIPPDATDAQVRQFHAQLQQALDRVREFAERS
jgi:lysophospholipid acyltransferase (LPLAT)-like uncharacterized protein